MDLKKPLMDAVKKNVNAPGLVGDLLDNVVEEALKEAVKKTSTPLDDMAMAALYPVLAEEVKKMLEKVWNDVLA